MLRHTQRGFTLVEMMIAMAVMLLATGGLFGFLVNNARLNKMQRSQIQVQSNARTCLSLLTQKLRSAGWDPTVAGLGVVTLDPNLSDSVSQIEIFADIDGDGKTITAGEQITIRHRGNTIEWRTTGDTSKAFDTVAVGISNDANGDGTPEPMFVADSTTDPTQITIQITAESANTDPLTGEPVRYTVSSVVALRKKLRGP